MKNLMLTLFTFTLVPGSVLATVAEDDALIAATITQKNFRAPFDQVWDAAVNASVDMGLQIQTLNEEAGLISCPNTALSPKDFKGVVATTGWTSKYKNCFYQATLLIKAPAPDITTVKIMVKLTAEEEKSGSIWDLTASKADFQSNGSLELKYFEHLRNYMPTDLEIFETGAVTKTKSQNTTTCAGTLQDETGSNEFAIFLKSKKVGVVFTCPPETEFHCKVLGSSGKKLGDFDLNRKKGKPIKLTGGGKFSLIVYSEAGTGAWTAVYTDK